MPSQNIKTRNIIWAILIAGTYSVMFWGLEREDFVLYFSLISFAFLFHIYPFSKWGLRSRPVLFIGIGLLIRLMAVSAVPTLSEDIYRYIWDGYLSQVGISPYALTPEESIRILSVQEHPLIHSLYPLLNSPNYYSVYPPMAQTFFSFGGWLGASWGITAAVTGLKLLFLSTELIGWFFIYLLFQIQKADAGWLWSLWLNPLLILEWNYSGHIESVACSFLLISVYMIWIKKNYLSAVLLALAVLVKLWPLLFAPFFIKYLKSSTDRIKWISAFILTGVLGSLPLLIEQEYLLHFKSSLDLYFKTFEFNASIYYLLRAIGTLWYGYNPIHIFGPLITSIMIGICILLYLKRQVLTTLQLIDSILLTGIIYLLFSTTVHPWYLTVFLPFAYLNARRSLALWSYLIFASYHAYSYIPVGENSIILIFTYSIVLMAIGKDWKYGREVNN